MRIRWRNAFLLWMCDDSDGDAFERKNRIYFGRSGFTKFDYALRSSNTKWRISHSSSIFSWRDEKDREREREKCESPFMRPLDTIEARLSNSNGIQELERRKKSNPLLHQFVHMWELSCSDRIVDFCLLLYRWNAKLREWKTKWEKRKRRTEAISAVNCATATAHCVCVRVCSHKAWLRRVRSPWDGNSCAVETAQQFSTN